MQARSFALRPALSLILRPCSILRQSFAGIFVAAIFTHVLSETLSLAEILERADALYVAREDKESVRASLRLLQAAPAPLDYEILWRLGRALFFLGQESIDKSASLASHHQAISFCREAVALEPQRVEGHFWLGVNLALLAQLSNIFRAPLMALRAGRSLRRAAQIDAAYHAAGPLRVLARLEAHLPRIIGGGTNRARAHFEKALTLAPENTVTRIYFAEMLIKTGAAHQAQKELRAIINTPPNPAWAFEIARDKKQAVEMLKSLMKRKG